MNYSNFEQSALPHITVLQTYAIFLTKNSENAKDLLQETYLRAYRFWYNFEEGTNIKAWLYCIMRNSFINLYRRETKEPKKVEYQEYHLPCDTTQEISFSHKYMPGKFYNEIFEDEIACSIDSLNDAYRNILVLSDVEGRTYQEIASIIGCPIGTVRFRLFRGRKLLKEKLFNYAKENRYIPKGSQG
jgi:RNA polymerase sigma-70 factor, ECF subfamily